MAAGETNTNVAVAERQHAGDTDHGQVDVSERTTDAGNGSRAQGPFTSRQLMRIDEAMSAADRETGLTFSVYVGALEESSRAHAERLLDQLPSVVTSVLIAIDPDQRKLEIVTGDQARRRLPERVCALASMSMTASFGVGDLTGGVVTGLRMLTDQAL